MCTLNFPEFRVSIIMRKTLATIAVSFTMLFIFAGMVPVSGTLAPSGTVSYFQVSGDLCTSTLWTNVASDGNVPGMLPNNVGGPPETAVVGTGSICIKVALSGVTSRTFTVTSNKLTGSLTLNSGNSFSAEGVYTSSYDGQCTTVPLVISPSGTVGSTSGQINHVFVGTGCTTTSTSTTRSTTTPTGVPQFPIAGSLGLLLVVAIAAPLLVAARKLRSPIQMS